MPATTFVTWKVLDIDFDFEMEDDVYPSEDYQKQVKDNAMNKLWTIGKDEELEDVISDATGWCINEIWMEEVK